MRREEYLNNLAYIRHCMQDDANSDRLWMELEFHAWMHELGDSDPQRGQLVEAYSQALMEMFYNG